MDPSNGQHQVMSNQTLETLIVSSKQTHQDQKKPRPQPEEVIKCPRCESSNTKFCYYNNYSLSQPRYFCKSCRRYWTKGGTLRNVPVGGGYRKNKRSNSSSRNKINHEEPLICAPNSNPLMGYDPIDLSLAFARLQRQPPSSSAGNLGFGGEVSIFGNSGGIGGNQSLENSIGNGGSYLGTSQNGNFNNLGYGFMGDHHQNSTTMSREMVMPYEEIKKDMCINGIGDFRRDESESTENQNKFLWGFPWQVNNGETGMGNSDVDSWRESWNGFGSSWHGLLNSPLM